MDHAFKGQSTMLARHIGQPGAWCMEQHGPYIQGTEHPAGVPYWSDWIPVHGAVLSDSPPPGSTAIRQSVKLKVSQTLQVGGCQFNAIF